MRIARFRDSVFCLPFALALLPWPLRAAERNRAPGEAGGRTSETRLVQLAKTAVELR